MLKLPIEKLSRAKIGGEIGRGGGTGGGESDLTNSWTPRFCFSIGCEYTSVAADLIILKESGSNVRRVFLRSLGTRMNISTTVLTMDHV